MTSFIQKQTDNIVQSCLDLFEKLPKTGKPIENEWTVLSCVVQYDNRSGKHDVVSLGTGSKCIGASKMSPSGAILNDSHAEVFAKRGFQLYIYNELENDSSIFEKHGAKVKLKENIEFVFYSSQMPCGDASIISKAEEDDQYGDVLQLNKRQANHEICYTEIKKIKTDTDIHRTGAKCLPDAKQDPKEAGSNYHLLGQVRTKPGRGDRTLSVSCSDKMARWVHMGIQGSLLDMLLLEPIYIKHFIFGAGVPYSEEALKRALLMRNEHALPIQSSLFYQSSLTFPFIKTANSIRPAPGSIIWAKINSESIEVGVQGKKLGLTKKKANCPNNSLCISKFMLYKKFHDVLHKKIEMKQEIFGVEHIETIPYNEMKKRSERYIQKWRNLKEYFFKTWTVKPDMWSFLVNTQY